MARHCNTRIRKLFFQIKHAANYGLKNIHPHLVKASMDFAAHAFAPVIEVNNTGVKIINPSLKQRRTLVDHVYCIVMGEIADEAMDLCFRITDLLGELKPCQYWTEANPIERL